MDLRRCKTVVGRTVTLCVLALSIASCNAFRPLKVEKLPPPKTLQDGVELNAVTIYSKSWPELVDSLSPKFTNTPDGALTQIDQVQNFSDNRFLSAMGIGAQIGVQFGPQISNSDASTRTIDSSDTSGTTVVNSDDTSRTITTKRVSDNAAPDQPAASAGTGDGRTATSLPDLIGATRNPTAEPFFRVSAANALYQEIALINDAVAGIPKYKDTKPYIIRLRVSVKPYRRDLPWDLYAHFTLFEDLQNGSDPIIVLPILATESYQGTMDASALQQLLDLRLSLQAAVANAKAGASFDKLNDQLTTFLTKRYESRLHVGGASGRSLQVKLSAACDKTGYALEDRDHFVTIVAYLKPPYQNEKAKRYRFYMDYEGRNAETAALVADNSGIFYDKMAPVIARLGLNATEINAGLVAPPAETLTEAQGGTSNPGPAGSVNCDSNLDRLLFNFADDIGLYDGRRAILDLAACFKPGNSQNAVNANALYLVSKATNARIYTSDTNFTFDLLPLSQQRIVAFDARSAPQVQATKKALTLAVPYTGELRLEDVTALLIPNADAKAGAFSPRGIALKTTGPVSQIVMDFPSLASMEFVGLPAIAVTKLKEPSGWDVCIATAPVNTSSCPATRTAVAVGTGIYTRSLAAGYSKTAAIDPPTFTLSTGAQAVKQAADGTVTFAIYVDPQTGSPVKITVSNGEILVGSVATQAVSVTAKSMINLTVRNPTAGALLVVRGVSAAASDPDTKTTKEISIAVQAATASPTNK